MSRISICILTIIFASTSSLCQTLPLTRGILDNVFLIETDTLTGSCFLIEYGDQDYLVTAAHLFKKEIKNKSMVNVIIRNNEEVKPITAQVLKHVELAVDIAVLKIPFTLKKTNPYAIGGGTVFGQDVFFWDTLTLVGCNLLQWMKI